MIIAFGGRLHSGKSVLSNVCEDFGYERIYFALPLKQLIASLIQGTIDDVNAQKTANFNKKLTNEQLNFISIETNIPFEIVEEKISNLTFHNTREMLQIIGTDLIREYNVNWHVNKIREMIEPSKNYVIDDLRFENEKNLILELNGIIFFVVRPNLEQISNHVSETTLRWQMFENIIINNNNLEQLKFRWEMFLENGLINSIIKRAQLIQQIANDEETKTKLLESNNNLDMFKMFFINKEELTYNDKFSDVLILNFIDKIENYNNSIYRVYYKNGEIEIITNPLMIEDLKFFDTKKD